MKTKRIIIAGGGTGGHIFPALAIAQALQRLDPAVELLFIGALGKMEMQKIPQAGYHIEGIDIVGWNRSAPFKNLGLPLKLLRSFWQVRKILKAFRPDAVVGVGGYASFPVLRYAQTIHIPTFIHESNALAGKSNRLLGKKVTKVFVPAEGMEKYFPPQKLVVTGNPVRKDIAESQLDQAEGLRHFQLAPGRLALLVIGGSLGARSINQAVRQGLESLAGEGLQLIWQTGKSEVADPAAEKASGLPMWKGPFIEQMAYAFAAADLVVSRAGAMAIAELCLAAKPVIFVPYPHAAEDHQTRNAQALVEKGAALLVPDDQAVRQLIPSVLTLARDARKRKEMALNLGRLGVRDADRHIAQEIFNSLGWEIPSLS